MSGPRPVHQPTGAGKCSQLEWVFSAPLVLSATPVFGQSFGRASGRRRQSPGAACPYHAYTPGEIMYVPPHFDESRPEVLFDLIEKNPLGILFSNGKSGLDANHIPFHLARGQGEHG